MFLLFEFLSIHKNAVQDTNKTIWISGGTLEKILYFIDNILHNFTKSLFCFKIVDNPEMS